jgi:hypothetical protein
MLTAVRQVAKWLIQQLWWWKSNRGQEVWADGRTAATQHPHATKMHYSAAWNSCVEITWEHNLHEPMASIQMLYFGNKQNGNWEKLSKFMIWRCIKMAKNLFSSQVESFLMQGCIRRTVCNDNPKMKILILFYYHMTGGSTDAWPMFRSAWFVLFWHCR